MSGGEGKYSDRLALLGSAQESELAPWLDDFPLLDGTRGLTNLKLIAGQLSDQELLAQVFSAALDSADPDQTLNLLERLFEVVPLDQLTMVLRQPERCRQLLSVLGGSQFLAGVLLRRAENFQQLLVLEGIDQSCSLEQMCRELRRRIPDSADFFQLKAGLRHFKAEQMLRIGSRDLCGLASLEEVTADLSSLASACLQRAYEICSLQLQEEYGAPLEETEDGQLSPAEFTILGMGKFGGNELNFSSDIDLIYCYSSSSGETAGGSRKEKISLHRYFVKLAELVTRALNQVTEDGFVFRVDTRLRPDGNSGDLAISLSAAEIYYESWGQSWERAAMIKARPVAGSIALGEELLQRLQPFVYRRYLDYGMIEDMKLMKQKINANLSREQEGERNLKLGRGGIREIEFFIQALQLINAGKNPRLQQRNSLIMLELLREEELVSAEECQLLSQAYRFLRTVEHRIQVVREQQTHSLPIRDEELLALARRCGFPGVGEFQQELARLRDGVHGIFHDLFHSADEVEKPARPEIDFLFAADSDPDLVKDLLEEKGFSNPDGAYESIKLLRGGDPHKRLTERGRRFLDRLAPLLMGEVLDCANPDLALNNLEAFLGRIRARTSFFALLAENPGIVKLLIALFSSSQLLSRIFVQRPELLDTLVGRSYAVESKSRQQLTEELQEQLEQAEDYERQLDVLRRFRNEEFLRIALGDLHGQVGQGESTLQLSWLAEVCLDQALQMARQELVGRFGVPCSEDGQDVPFAIVGMGKLGGLELNYHSDLDIIFIYGGEGKTRPAAGTDPDRFRQLSSQEYYAKLAQRIITVLTLVTREGSVYKIDTRLRPSGNQGPLVTSLDAFDRYHQESAQPWERQAMTKARVVSGPEDFSSRVQQLINRLTFERPLPENLQAEIFRLRGRMERELARESEDLLNIKTGRGGMVDVEFLTQYLQLLNGTGRPALHRQNTLELLWLFAEEGILPEAEANLLIGGYKFLRRLENKLRLLYDQSINELSGEVKKMRMVARSLGYTSSEQPPERQFLEEYRSVTEGIRNLFECYLKPPHDGLSGEGA